MTISTRAEVIALFDTLIQNAYPWQTFGTRLKQSADVSPASRPACFTVHAGAQRYNWSNTTVPRRSLSVLLYIYTSTPDQETSDAPIQNAILDALDAAMAADPVTGRNTLSRSVYNAQIKGPVLQVPGDLDGDGFMLVPVTLTLP